MLQETCSTAERLVAWLRKSGPQEACSTAEQLVYHSLQARSARTFVQQATANSVARRPGQQELLSNRRAANSVARRPGRQESRPTGKQLEA